MRTFLRTFLITLLLLVVIGTAFLGGVLLDRQGLIPLGSGQAPRDAAANFILINQAWNIIKRNYADRSVTDNQTLTYGAISGMVDALGDTGHSRFLSPEMVKEENNFTAGQFEGIGALMQMKDTHIVVVAPYDGSPAQKAGLKPGDILVKVNGEDITGQTLTEVVGKVLGPAGTTVTLTIADPVTGETRDVTITRARIDLKNVTWNMLPGTTIGQIRIAAFSQNVTNDVKNAIQDLQQQGATGLVLDMRSNPGGLLDEGIGVASLFLKSGNVLLEKDANGNIKPEPIKEGIFATDLPLVVLVDQGTASASEIVAGALQDAGRAKIIGEKTYGTGTVLLQFPLSDGSSILLATKQWLTPNGRAIWHQGITPDEVVSLPANVSAVIPEMEKDMNPQQLQDSQDTQLLRAIQILISK
jgi:carboxyl-terminal processing protease